MLTLLSTSHFISFLVTCIFLVASDEEPPVIRLEQTSKIIPIDPTRHILNDVGPVGGLRQCGGPGRAIAMRYFYCNGDYPCKIPGDGIKRPAELEFIPSQDIQALGLRGIVFWDGGMQTLVNQSLSNSSVLAGQSYISTSAGGAKKELVGKKFTYQWILYRVEDDQVEVCGEADLEVV